VDRRRFVGASVTAGLGLIFDQPVSTLVKSAGYVLDQPDCLPPQLRGGTLVGAIELDELEAPGVPLGRVVGEGLDARQFTDLSTLTRDTLVTSNDRFFVRTAQPRLARDANGWRIAIEGLVDRPQAVTAADLAGTAAPAGIHLLECAGNARSGRFGLISAARWDGVPLTRVLDLAAPRAAATHVLVAGMDDPGPSFTSAAGASWVFTRQQIADAGAFLATRMNGEPLPADHGAPVRLVVPGWYGCACIKWVNRIALIDSEALATDQMKEFAARTHQAGIPPLAREYQPATIDFAAMPVRVEQWRVNGRPVCHVSGIAWGGDTRTPPPTLTIRFNPREAFVPLNGCPIAPEGSLRSNWSLWTHVWQPSEPGRYQIVLKADGLSVRTRRLDLYFYTRTIRIREV
jgi:DMSO/TMAO reductase YedYZ molybdopterin-dependent catalytic subunit